MDHLPDLPKVPLELAVRIGCKLQYEAVAETPTLLSVRPRQDIYQFVAKESFTFTPVLTPSEFEDDHENTVSRLTLQPGWNTLIYDAITYVPSLSEDFAHLDLAIPPQWLTPRLLRYTLPSRYCDSDKLRDFAWQNFGHHAQGIERVQAICDWLHRNIEYRTGSGSPEISAHDVIQRGYGVCRDLAHCGVALCRTFNLPTRYVSGYVADIACLDPGTPMDFHAYFEVYMGGRWQVFDARFNTPRTGRIRISTGYDAASCAFSTCYGSATLRWFEVWSYQIDPDRYSLNDPVDLSQRVCGTPELWRPSSLPSHT